jgi:hypothetical protein
MSAIDRLRAFLEDHVGEVFSTNELREVAGIWEYARCVRALRDKEGMQIRTHKDCLNLSPGQYVLESLVRVYAISPTVPLELRDTILEHNDYSCHLCGYRSGDEDPCNPRRKVRLYIDYPLPAGQDCKYNMENVSVLCANCYEGRRYIQTPSESAINLLQRIRRQPRAVQREVYEALRKTFGEA